MSGHWPFVIAAYAVAALIVAAMILAIALDHRALARRLGELEKGGARRAGSGAR